MANAPRGLRSKALTQRDKDMERAKVKPSRAWYNSKAWRARRAAQLANFPACRFHWECEGVAVEATVADHVEPHREDYERFWDGELQSLCATCHSSVKQREERR